jgi:hypothetical protein
VRRIYLPTPQADNTDRSEENDNSYLLVMHT